MKPLKILLIVASFLLVLIIGSFVMIALFFEDPAPDRFDVGVELEDDGALVLYLGDCMGGQLQHISVAVDHEDGFGNADADTVLWSADAGERGGTSLAAGGVLEVEVGSVPEGMTETLSFEGELPATETVQVSVDTDRQGYGFFFETSELKEGEIWTGGSYTTAEEFEKKLPGWCP